jgi:Glycosyltransferase family 43
MGAAAVFLVNEDLSEENVALESARHPRNTKQRARARRKATAPGETTAATALQLCVERGARRTDTSSNVVTPTEYATHLNAGAVLPSAVVVLPSASQSSLSGGVRHLLDLLLASGTGKRDEEVERTMTDMQGSDVNAHHPSATANHPSATANDPTANHHLQSTDRDAHQLSFFVPAGWRLDPRSVLEQVHSDGDEGQPGPPVEVLHLGGVEHPLSASADLLHYLLVLQPVRKRYAPAPAQVSMSTPSSAHEHQRRLIVITPTYDRAVQRACLIRVAAQLAGVPNLLWVVVEDGERPLQSTRHFLESTGIEYVYLQQTFAGTMHRGVLQRNRALVEVERLGVRGVVMFFDDDNTVDQRYFAGARATLQLRLCSVGLVSQDKRRGEAIPCADVVHADADGRLRALWSSFEVSRPFPVDMLGIAVHTDLLQESRARFSLASMPGYLESDFVQEILTGCTHTEVTVTACPADDEIMLFHTRVAATQCNYPSNWLLDHSAIPFRYL